MIGGQAGGGATQAPRSPDMVGASTHMCRRSDANDWRNCRARTTRKRLQRAHGNCQGCKQVLATHEQDSLAFATHRYCVTAS